MSELSVRNKRSIGLAVVLCLGCAGFLLVADVAILDPRNTSWLMAGDPATHYLGWQFFRQAPLMQWPFGANPNYGMELSSSVVFTDSIPLLAFVCKPLSPWLPAAFQYFGIWIFSCFLLQSYFAWRLLRNVMRDAWLPLVGSAFFVIAPFLLWRLKEHYALFGQWVILAAIFLYGKEKFSAKAWILLLCVTALIHAYLFVMVAGLWTADMVKRMLAREVSLTRLAATAAVGIGSTVLVMWCAGYFMLKSGVVDGGFGIYRMNLFSIVDPDDTWSVVLRDLKSGRGEYEGFSFLGVGVLMLGAAAAYHFSRRAVLTLRAKHLPIVVVSVLFVLFALSNNIAAGDHVILSYPLPRFAKGIAGMLRVSGRFIWPVAYLLLTGILVVLSSAMKQRPAVILCVCALAAQLADSHRAFSAFHEKFGGAAAYASPLRSAEWETIAGRYKKIIVVPPGDRPEQWMVMADFAAARRMAINAGYFARIDDSLLRRMRMEQTNAIVTADLDPDALYFFDDDLLWNVAVVQLRSGDRAGILDGLRFIAPRYRSAAADGNAAPDAPAAAAMHAFTGSADTKIPFDTNAAGRQFCVYGWSEPESWGTWSDGDSSLLLMRVELTPRTDTKVSIDGRAFLTGALPAQEVEVSVNGHYLCTETYTLRQNVGIRSILIPGRYIEHSRQLLALRFRYKNPRSLADLGLSPDARRLGLGIISLEISQR